MAAKYIDTITDRAGNALAGATVQALDQAEALMVLYLDPDLTTPIGTSARANDNGLVQFYIPDGTYTIRQVYSGTSVSIPNVELYDLTDLRNDANATTADKARAVAIGIAADADNLGTFAGNIIPDNSTVKGSLQSLSDGVNLTSPLLFAAAGDGTTDDTAVYTAQEAVGDVIDLPDSKTYNIGSTIPTRPVFGPGSLVIGGDIYGGNGGHALKAYPFKSSVILNPVGHTGADWLYDTFPGGGGHGNTIFGAGIAPDIPITGDTQDVVRTTLFGSMVAQKPVKLNRVDAFGQGAIRWTRYAERVTAVGTLAFQWGGAKLTEDTTGRYYYHDLIYNIGTPVTDPSWDRDGLETANPGIRQRIVDWMNAESWVATTDEFSRNVAFGRDAGCDFLKGTENAFLGYRAAGYSIELNNCTFVGSRAGEFSVFGNHQTFVGLGAGRNSQEGLGSTAVGSQALGGFVKSTRNVGVGYNAGSGCSGATGNNIYIGAYSGAHDPGSNHAYRFYVNSGGPGYMVGDMAAGKLGVGSGMTYADLAATDALYLRFGGAVGGLAPPSFVRGIVLERGDGPTGITVKTTNAYRGHLNFADGESNAQGIIFYDHPGDYMEFRTSNTRRMRLDANGVNLSGIPTSATGLTTGQLWNDGGTLKIAA